MSGKSWGIILLALWLLLYGLLAVTNFRFEAEHLVMGLLAIAAAIALFLGK
jgi:hypothetical protein